MRLRLAVALCLLSGWACAEPAAQLYGRLNLGVEALRGGEQRTRLSNYRSVLGVRGSEAVGGGTRLLYQVEGTLALDTGAGAIAARDTRIGFEGPWGTLFAGNWATPYTSATSSLDPFYPTTAGYMSIMGNGSASTSDNATDTSAFDRRQQNSVHYWSPAWRGISLRLAHGVNEERLADGARPSLTSSAIVFEHGALYAALAWERHHKYHGAGTHDGAIKLALARQVGAWRLAIVAERLRYQSTEGSVRRRAWYLSATRQLGAHTLRLGVARAGDGAGTAVNPIGFVRTGPDTGAIHYTLGYDLALSKRTGMHMFYTGLDNEARGGYDFATNSSGARAGQSIRAVSLGLRHAF